MKIRFNALALMTALAFIPALSQASLVELDFFRITNNNTEDVSGQLSAHVRDQSAAADFGNTIATNEVLFTFQNNASIASNITEVYFDDGVIFEQTSIINSISGFTNFNDGGNNGINPDDLPNANAAAPVFVATAGFGADTQGNPNNGVNASNDIFGIVIELLPTVTTFDQVQTALHNGDLRLGLHVRSIGADGGSDSFVNNPGPPVIAPVPVPAAVWLFGSGLITLIGRARKK